MLCLVMSANHLAPFSGLQNTLLPVNTLPVSHFTIALSLTLIPPAMIFLADNVLLETELKPDHIKPRLLGEFTLSSRINWSRVLIKSLRSLGNVPRPYSGVVTPQPAHPQP